MIFEVELRGFDPKEDAVDGASSETVFVVMSQAAASDSLILDDAMLLGSPHIHWNKKLSKVVRRVQDCVVKGYEHTIRHEIKCKNCKRVFRGSTHLEAEKEWKAHNDVCAKKVV